MYNLIKKYTTIFESPTSIKITFSGPLKFLPAMETEAESVKKALTNVLIRIANTPKYNGKKVADGSSIVWSLQNIGLITNYVFDNKYFDYEFVDGVDMPTSEPKTGLEGVKSYLKKNYPTLEKYQQLVREDGTYTDDEVQNIVDDMLSLEIAVAPKMIANEVVRYLQSLGCVYKS